MFHKMSGNINDTDVKRIRDTVMDMIKELDSCENQDDIDIIGDRYTYIKDVSSSLHTMIIEQYKHRTFDKTVFTRNLNTMLSTIERIQQARISQYDASRDVGEMLASQFIPQLRK